MRVLIIEPDATTAELLGLLLKDTGHEVYIAGNEAEGVQGLKTLGIELVVIDKYAQPFGAAERLISQARGLERVPRVYYTLFMPAREYPPGVDVVMVKPNYDALLLDLA